VEQLAKKPKRVYWVDLPNPSATSDDDTFLNVRTFDRRKDAYNFLRKTFGMPTRVAGFFVSWGEK
jgi:hypothetical protein